MYSIIKEWLSEVISDGSWESYNSLHIYDIDEKYEDDSSWFEVGLECLNTAITILDELSISDKKVFLLYSLIDGEEEKGINYNNASEFIKQFDDTPPSLYLYEEEWDGYRDTINEGVLINDSILNIQGLSVYHVEYKEDGDNEYRRSVMVIKK